jgi:predicted nucleotidyltransferase
MNNFAQIKKTIGERKGFLAEKFNVKSCSVFGSCLRGAQTQESDIDILVEFDRAVDLFQFIRLEDFLSELLGAKVDLVTKPALKPRIKDRILKEAVEI